MPLTPAHLPPPPWDGIHRDQNRRQLVRQLFAVAGVGRYGFLAGCDRALLLRAGLAFWPRQLGPALIEPGDQSGDGSLLLALPHVPELAGAMGAALSNLAPPDARYF